MTIYESDHELFRDSFRSFAEQELVPHVPDWERAGIMDRAVYVEAGKHGFVGMAVPEEYGGGGVHDFRFNAVLDEEVARLNLGGGGLGHDAAQRHHHAVLHRVLHRRAARALAARHRFG